MIARTTRAGIAMLDHLVATCLAASVLFVGACKSSGASADSSASAERAIVRVLDDWHRAASAADGARYLGHMAEDAVFLGTDASERWTLPAFRAFCEPYFSKGTGWTYEPRERNLRVEGRLAWFDERLWNDKYGECRGTGVLREDGGTWKIVHYSLTFPVPNELAADVVKLIRGR
jgi:ketosteroid isomerase-like protein